MLDKQSDLDVASYKAYIHKVVLDQKLSLLRISKKSNSLNQDRKINNGILTEYLDKTNKLFRIRIILRKLYNLKFIGYLIKIIASVVILPKTINKINFKIKQLNSMDSDIVHLENKLNNFAEIAFTEIRELSEKKVFQELKED